MRPIIQPHAPHNRNIPLRQRPQQPADDIPLPRPLQPKQPGLLHTPLQHLDLQLSLQRQAVDIRLRVREDGVTVSNTAVAGADVADQAVPGGGRHLTRWQRVDVPGDLEGAADGSWFEGVEERRGHWVPSRWREAGIYSGSLRPVRRQMSVMGTYLRLSLVRGSSCAVECSVD